MTADNGGCGTGLHALGGSVLAEMGSLRTDLTGEAKSLRTDMRSGFTAVNQRIDGVHERIDSVNPAGHRRSTWSPGCAASSMSTAMSEERG